MPYLNEHAARVNDPGKYKRIRRQNDKFGTGIHAIFGVLDDGTVELQAIRFDKSKFTSEQAKAWLKKHNYAKASFEKASEKKESIKDFTDSIYSFQLLESDSKGKTWDVCLIAEGFSKNSGTHGLPRFYPESTLRKAVSFFEKAPAMAYKFVGKLKDLFDHQPDEIREQEGLAGNQIGFFENVHFGEFTTKDGEKKKGILAKFHILEGADWLRKNLLDAWNKGVELLGFSIDADGSEVPKEHNGTWVDYVNNISRVIENTVVTRAAAGGQVLRLVASQTDDNNESKGTKMDREKLIKLLKEKAPHLFESKNIEELTDEQILNLLQEALDAKAKMQIEEDEEEKKKKQQEEEEKKKKEEEEDEAVQESKNLLKQIEDKLNKLTEYEKRIDLKDAQNVFKSKVQESNLPQAIKDKLLKQNSEKMLKESEVDALIADEQDTIAKMKESIPSSYSGIEFGSEEKDKFILAMEGFWEGKDQVDKDGKKVRRFNSFKEAYGSIMGDPLAYWASSEIILGDAHYWVPELKECPMTEAYNYQRRRSIMQESLKFREALKVSDWAEILASTLHRKMMKEWADDEYQSWRKITSSIIPLNDFRTHYSLMMGGYGTLSTVSEQATYQPLTSPQDTHMSYTPAKKGGLESITMEMVANDDVGAIRKIPVKLGKSAAITLYRSVFDMFNSNLQQDGSTALASNALGNAPGSAATLAGSTFTAGVTAMRKLLKYYGTSPDNVDYLGVAWQPKYILIPPDLEDTAMRLYQQDVYISNAGTGSYTENNLHKGKAEPIILPYWSGTSTSIWWLVADPARSPTVEVGFFRGQEEPELFVQDNPTVGSVFTSDKITYKIRYIYGFGIEDWRSFYRSA